MDIHVESDGKILGVLKSWTANIEGQSNSDAEIGEYIDRMDVQTGRTRIKKSETPSESSARVYDTSYFSARLWRPHMELQPLSILYNATIKTSWNENVRVVGRWWFSSQPNFQLQKSRFEKQPTSPPSKTTFSGNIDMYTKWTFLNPHPPISIANRFYF